MSMLRAATASAHASIETAPAFRELMQPTLSRTAYIAVLQRLLGFHIVVEPVIAASLETCPVALGLLDGARPRALAEDLVFFATEPGPILNHAPTLHSVASALGALYVIEGASLGGRVIARHLYASIGVEPQHGGSFYCGQSAATARQRWGQLIDCIEGHQRSSHGVKSSDRPALVCEPDSAHAVNAEMIAGARGMFQCMEHWMRAMASPVDHETSIETVAP
jgi:heme oxygenase